MVAPARLRENRTGISSASLDWTGCWTSALAPRDQDLEKAMVGHVLQKGEAMATYGR